MKKTVSVAWKLLLALYIGSSLYEGYLVVPGLGPHSLFSLIQRVLVFTLPLVVLYLVIRGDRRLFIPIASLTIWLAIVGLTYLTLSPHTHYYFYYVWSQVGGYLLVLSFWFLAQHPSWLRWIVGVTVPLYFTATMILSVWEMPHRPPSVPEP